MLQKNTNKSSITMLKAKLKISNKILVYCQINNRLRINIKILHADIEQRLFEVKLTVGRKLLLWKVVQEHICSFSII